MSSKQFEFDEDTYKITFTFSGNDGKNYQLTIFSSYQDENYIQLDEITGDLKKDKVLSVHTNEGIDSLWEALYPNHTQPILAKIWDLTEQFMKIRNM